MKEKIKVGYSFEEVRIFSESELKKIAMDCGDMNFVHHDSTLSKETRFSGIIASGSAISAIFSAMIPTHLSKISPMLGLEMSFKFPAPIKPGVMISMVWCVSEIQKKSEADIVVNLQGEIKDNEGKLLVLGSAKVILLAQL